ncbi:MAG: hypothetical protein ACP5UK_00740 [Conexivisphaera sp.]
MRDDAESGGPGSAGSGDSALSIPLANLDLLRPEETRSERRSTASAMTRYLKVNLVEDVNGRSDLILL